MYVCMNVCMYDVCMYVVKKYVVLKMSHILRSKANRNNNVSLMKLPSVKISFLYFFNIY